MYLIFNFIFSDAPRCADLYQHFTVLDVYRIKSSIHIKKMKITICKNLFACCIFQKKKRNVDRKIVSTHNVSGTNLPQYFFYLSNNHLSTKRFWYYFLECKLCVRFF